MRQNNHSPNIGTPSPATNQRYQPNTSPNKAIRIKASSIKFSVSPTKLKMDKQLPVPALEVPSTRGKSPASNNKKKQLQATEKLINATGQNSPTQILLKFSNQSETFQDLKDQQAQSERKLMDLTDQK